VPPLAADIIGRLSYDDIWGTFKEGVGKVTGNRQMAIEGQVDKGKGKLKEAVRKATNKGSDFDRGREL
jgi:uncharacterized protein YjbJ (UPF0337 family)